MIFFRLITLTFFALLFALTPSFAQNTPTTVPGLKVWLKADTGITLNAGNVASWADVSGNGNNATQANPPNQPEYVSAAFNGKPVVRFTDDFLQTPAFNIGTRTEFLVLKSNGPPSGAYHCMLTNSAAPYYQLYVLGNFNSFIGSSNVDHNIPFQPQFQIISRVIAPAQVQLYQNGNPGIPLSVAATATNQPIQIGLRPSCAPCCILQSRIGKR